MKHIRLLHNPGAGTTAHAEEKIIAKIEEMGFTCSYYSTKETDPDNLVDDSADIIALAGGDGTVRKLVHQLLQRKMLDKRFPIGLIPYGTANNIARMLKIDGTQDEIITRWKSQNIQRYDIAQVSGLKDQAFVMEGLGFGVFPKLIKRMKAMEQSDDPEQQLKQSLKQLHEIISEYKGRECTITIDGEKYTGQYLMVEVMNTQSVGPNLNIAPAASISDGLLDVVMVPVSQRQTLADYVHDRMVHGKDELFFGIAVKGSDIKIEWSGRLLHADDQLVQLKKPTTVRLSARREIVEFLV